MKKNVLVLGMLFSSMVMWAEIPAGYGGTPNNPVAPGQPHAVPCVIEAEWWDNGGEGISYQSQLGGFGIDTSCGGCTDNISVNKINGIYNQLNNSGDWICYTISSQVTQMYNIAIRTRYNANGDNSATFKVYLDDEEVSGNLVIFASQSWACDVSNWPYQFVPDPVEITEGSHVLKIEFTKGYPNFDNIAIFTGKAKNPDSWGNPHDISDAKFINAEYWDYGGEGVAYHSQMHPETGFKRDYCWYNTTSSMRCSIAEINNDMETGSGDWVTYTFNNPTAGLYDIEARIRYGYEDGRFRLSIDDVEVGEEVDIIKGSWNCDASGWSDYLIPGVVIPKGEHVLKVDFIWGNPNVDGYKFNLIEALPDGIPGVAYAAGKAYMKGNVLTLSGYSANASVEVFNLVGQKTHAIKADKKITLSNGIYIVKVRDFGRTETHKVLAQ